MIRSDAQRTVGVYVRSLAAGDKHPPVREVLSSLDELQEAGAIDVYTVHVWGYGLSLDERVSDTDVGRSTRESITAFTDWADETDHTLVGFQERTTHSQFSGRVHRNTVVPMLALCERADETIERVSPCRNAEGRLTTVADHLTALEGDDERDAGQPE